MKNNIICISFVAFDQHNKINKVSVEVGVPEMQVILSGFEHRTKDKEEIQEIIKYFEKGVNEFWESVYAKYGLNVVDAPKIGYA